VRLEILGPHVAVCLPSVLVSDAGSFVLIDGKSTPLFESGAILLYLAEKTGKLIPKDGVERLHTIQWLFWQMAGLGPMFGQFGHFYHYAPEKLPYAIKRYTDEARRLLGVLEKQLEGHDYIVGNEYTIADIAIAPWVYGLDHHYKAKEQLKLEEFPRVEKWLRSILKRPAVLKAYAEFNIEFKADAFGSPL
jgi:GSH-dependent disulfide-bond oxidoreductase